MDKKNYILIMLILFLPFVTATYSTNIPNYLDVNTTEYIYVENGEIPANESGYIIIDGIIYNLTKNTNNFSIGITNNEESNTSYQILITDVILDNISISDGTNETQLIISNNTIYGGKEFENTTHLVGFIENHGICAYIKKKNVLNPTIYAIVFYNNGTAIHETLSLPKTITNSNFQYICFDMHQSYTETVVNYTEYIGIYCDDCTTSPDRGYIIGIDNTSSLNKSFVAVNTTSIINITTHNFLMKLYEYDETPHFEEEGLLLFRIPYYVTFKLYETQNQTFTTNFNYLYLRQTQTLTYTQMGIYFGSFLRPKIVPDYTETFWGIVVDDTATIKLYNAGTYYITLQTMKTFNPTVWNFEFYKPQYTHSLSETNIEDELIIHEKNNTSYNIILNDYELNKPSHFLKIIKWCLFFSILIIGLVGAVYSGQPLAFFSVIILWLMMLLIFVFVGWL